MTDPEVLRLDSLTNLTIFPSQKKRRITQLNTLDHDSFFTLSFHVTVMRSSSLLCFSTDFVGCNLIRSLFLLCLTGEEGKSRQNSHQIKKFSHRWWCLNDAYVMFIRNSPLLDILHRDFLYRAPWHDILLLHPRLKRKNNQIDRQNPLLASTSDQTRLRKFARRRFFVIRLLRILKIPLEGDKGDVLWFRSGRFPVQHSPARISAGVNHQPVLPSDQTPSLSRLAHSHVSERGSGMDQPSSVSGDRQAQPSSSLLHLKPDHYSSSCHTFGRWSTQHNLSYATIVIIIVFIS